MFYYFQKPWDSIITHNDIYSDSYSNTIDFDDCFGPVEISYNNQGNFWGRTEPPYFCEYGNPHPNCINNWDSDSPDVIDSYPYARAYPPGKWPEPPGLLGDITQDGKINVNDWQKFVNFIMDIEVPTETEKELADLNANGKLDRHDYLLLEKLIESKLTQKDLPMLLGDVNQDKIINSQDAILVGKYLAGKLNFSEQQKLLGDTNANKRIDKHDTKLILHTSAQIIIQKDLPIEMGDFDNNDIIKSNDVIKVMKYVNSTKTPTKIELLYGDMNLNERFDKVDLDEIYKMVGKYIIEDACLIPPVG